MKKTLMVEEGYERLGNFKARVIDVAARQINEHSDIAVSYTQRKTGRNVTHFIFSFAPKDPPAAGPGPKPPEPVAETPLVRRLRALGLPAKLAAGWESRDPARALAAAAYVERKMQAGEVKTSPAGYLRSAFEGGGELDPGAAQARQKAAQAQARRQAEAAKAARQAEEERVRAGKQAASDAAMAWFEALPEDGRQALEQAFRAEADPYSLDLFKKRGHAYPGFRHFVSQAWLAARAG